MVTIKEALNAYTMGMAHCLRAQVFFNQLKNSFNTKSVRHSTDKARADVFSGKMTHSSLELKYGAAVVKKCMKNSLDHCLHMAETRTSADTSLGVCIVCLERGANYYIVHGSSAHKCVCSVCAMDIALRSQKPKCPVSREPVWLMVESTNESYGCVCLKETCQRFLVLEQTDNEFKTSKTFRVKECHMCSMESFHATFCRLFFLY